MKMKSVRAFLLPAYQILILPLNLAAKPAPTPIGSTPSFIEDWLKIYFLTNFSFPTYLLATLGSSPIHVPSRFFDSD